MDEYRDEPHDDPAAAFERLRGEVSLLRVAIEGLTTARESIEIPDYEPTLARTERVLTVLTEQLEPIVESPALALTTHRMASEIASASISARREDKQLLDKARSALDQAVQNIGNRLASARDGEDQNRWLWLAGLGGLVAGLLLYAGAAGPIARRMPTSWQLPEGMARRVLAEPTQWDAGRHLMMTDSPDTWSRVVAAVNLVGDNRDTLQACERAAAKAKKSVHCTIEVKPEGAR